MSKNTVIFDLDGTILETRRDLAEAVNYALRSVDSKEITIDDVVRNTGNGIRKLIERSLGDERKEYFNVAFEAFKEYYKYNCTVYTHPYPNMKEVLYKLKSKGYKLAVISNKANSFVQVIIRFYYDGIFDFVIGGKEGYKLKPEPDLVNLCLKELGSNKEESIFIGDSLVDFETAKNSEMDYILCSYGFRSKEELEKAGVKNIIDAPIELLSLL